MPSKQHLRRRDMGLHDDVLNELENRQTFGVKGVGNRQLQFFLENRPTSPNALNAIFLFLGTGM